MSAVASLSNDRSVIKILHVITTVGRGGAERQLVNLISNTDRSRFEHTVAFLRKPDDFVPDIEAAGAKAICLDVKAKTPWIQAAWKLRQLIKSEEPAILHTWLYDANISARLASLFSSRIPSIVSLQNADYETTTVESANLSHTKVRVIKYIDKVSARWTRPTFVACSEFVRHSASKHLGLRESKVELIYNSVDPQGMTATVAAVDELRESLEIPPDAFVFLNIGRLDPQKGQPVLLKAFKKVADRMPKAYLVILGHGPLKDSLSGLAGELGLSERVRMPGARPNVGAFLALADVFVFPSFFEGLPLALIEAMSKGLPCIVSEIETLGEVVKDEDTGSLVSPGNEDQLAQAMVEMYENPAKRKSLGERALNEVNRKFHISATIKQWEALYSQKASMGSITE